MLTKLKYLCLVYGCLFVAILNAQFTSNTLRPQDLAWLAENTPYPTDQISKSIKLTGDMFKASPLEFPQGLDKVDSSNWPKTWPEREALAQTDPEPHLLFHIYNYHKRQDSPKTEKWRLEGFKRCIELARELKDPLYLNAAYIEFSFYFDDGPHIQAWLEAAQHLSEKLSKNQTALSVYLWGKVAYLDFEELDELKPILEALNNHKTPLHNNDYLSITMAGIFQAFRQLEDSPTNNFQARTEAVRQWYKALSQNYKNLEFHAHIGRWNLMFLEGLQLGFDAELSADKKLYDAFSASAKQEIQELERYFKGQSRKKRLAKPFLYELIFFTLDILKSEPQKVLERRYRQLCKNSLIENTPDVHHLVVSEYIFRKDYAYLADYWPKVMAANPSLAMRMNYLSFLSRADKDSAFIHRQIDSLLAQPAFQEAPELMLFKLAFFIKHQNEAEVFNLATWIVDQAPFDNPVLLQQAKLYLGIVLIVSENPEDAAELFWQLIEQESEQAETAQEFVSYFGLKRPNRS